MGVTGLWQVVKPCGRPIKLETLNRKRLAVDASIWIYQFLKAVRDKEGNALRNSHVVGFFRRICKLLFFGIKPVFVFDGGAPALKRQTIIARKSRREGRREDAARTAGKLLAVQMQRIAEAEERRRREDHVRPVPQEEEVPDELVYREELFMTDKERRQNRTFRKKDAYHLPDLDASLSEMGAPNDPRIMSQEELEEYARQFHTGEDINIYDFSKIDFNSPFFQSLPAADRYNILNAARLRSRLRMGYSKEQLDTMFPDRMAFSRFQIERVKERNELTQRLMNLNGMTGDEFINGTQRVAGERGKEYVLVKNDGVEGGWALGVVSNKEEGERDRPIDVENIGIRQKKDEDDDWEDEAELEDVPMEGVNRLPKQPLGKQKTVEPTEHDDLRAALPEQDEDHVIANDGKIQDSESLFLPPEDLALEQEDENDVVFEDVLTRNDEDDEDLRKAIAMSLDNDIDTPSNYDEAHVAAMLNGPRTDQSLQYNRKNAQAGRAYAKLSNSHAQASVVSAPSNNAFTDTVARRLSPKPEENAVRDKVQPPSKQQNHGFSGPLPFESLNLGGSFLRKKKKPEQQGGFENDDTEKKNPLPPWFSGDTRDGINAQKAMEARQMEAERDQPDHENALREEPLLRLRSADNIIDVDLSQPSQNAGREMITLDSSADESDDIEMGDIRPVEKKSEPIVVDSPPNVPSVAEEPPVNQHSLPPYATEASRHIPSGLDEQQGTETAEPDVNSTVPSNTSTENKAKEEIEWSESSRESSRALQADPVAQDKSNLRANGAEQDSSSSPEPDFEDVNIENAAVPGYPAHDISELPDYENTIELQTTEPLPAEDFSDSEDEELMKQLAEEAEEHARFAASLNADATRQSIEDYERELKQLRTQQKKDRRDADEVTHVMITECQQLLQLFGLPYITAPMEAEAQCAELVRLGLVDGIVTDDSDIFLFGGTRVYKNMFNQAKYVECYLASDLEKEYGLSREKIIHVAHLLGSDYTEGLPGIGPVTALEILSEFPDLESFQAWWTEVQSSHGQSLASSDKQSGFRKKFRKNITKLFLPPGFPDPRVNEAYLHPDVDHDEMPFQWGVPDLDALRTFLMQTVGWTRDRADEILVPVVRDMNQREAEGTQSNITRYFTGTAGTGLGRMRGLAGDHGGKQNADRPPADSDMPAEAPEGESFAPRRREAGGSKRMATALGKLHNQAQKRAGAAAPQRTARSGNKRSTATDRGSDEDHSSDDAEEDQIEDHREESVRRPRKARKSDRSKRQ